MYNLELGFPLVTALCPPVIVGEWLGRKGQLSARIVVLWHHNACNANMLIV